MRKREVKLIVGIGVMQAIAAMGLLTGAFGVAVAFGDEPVGVRVLFGGVSLCLILLCSRILSTRVAVSARRVTIVNVFSTRHVDRAAIEGVEAPSARFGYGCPHLVLRNGERIRVSTGLEAHSQFPGRVYNRLMEALGSLR